MYVWNGKIDTPFTSRDWVFIKEAIYGGALPNSHAPSGQTDFVGRPREKEFLYDIVNNRHNGLDVDKIDYFERDGRASKTNESNNLKFLTDGFVGRGRYQGVGEEEQEFLMICYPHKMIAPANEFFQNRKGNHEAIYTHKKTKAAELQMVDLLLEADKHYSLLMSTQLDDPSAFPVPSSFDDFRYERLPISRAWMHPNLFLRTDDTIVSSIENMAIDSGESLGGLRQLINERRMHRMYKSVFEVELGELDDDLWGQSEDAIANELMLEQTMAQSSRGYKGSSEEGQLNGDQKQQVLTRADFIVDKREIHCGRKAQNPVAQMRFLKNKADKISLHGSPDKLPLCGELETVPLDTPRSFLRRTIRFFSRNPSKHELLSHICHSWSTHREDREEAANPNTEMKLFFDEEEEESLRSELQSESQGQILTQDVAEDLDSSPAPSRKRSYSEESINGPLARRKLYK